MSRYADHTFTHLLLIFLVGETVGNAAKLFVVVAALGLAAVLFEVVFDRRKESR